MDTQAQAFSAGHSPVSQSRIRRIASWLLGLAVFAAGGFWFFFRPSPSSPSALPELDPALLRGEAALAQVEEFVALGPRDSGTPGAEKAAAWIENRLRGLGLLAFTDEFWDETPSGPVIFRNVIGIIERGGPGIIILGSHYDTKSGISPDFAGANDSGSSTGLLLELAGILRQAPGKGPDIYLAFFDGEECLKTYSRNDGLHGSRHLVETLARNNSTGNVRAFFLLDMVGDRNLNIMIPRNSSPELAALIFEGAEKEGVRTVFSLSDMVVTDDHVPFLEAGIPSIDLIDFEFGSAPGKNDYWHTPQDTLDKLSPQSLQTVGRVVIRAVNNLLRNAGTSSPGK